MLTRYRDEVVPHKRGAAGIERIIIDAFLRHPLASTRLDRLTAAKVAAYRDERLIRVKPATICRELGLLQHAIDIAIHEWSVPMNGNPLRNVRKPRIDSRRERRLHADEQDRLIAAARKCRNALIPSLIMLGLETGMRRGELLAMRWHDVDLDRCTVMLPETKNGHARTVPLTPVAVQVLQSLPKTNARCLPLTACAVRQAWDRLCRRAGIDDLHLHDLRHEAISRLVERGLSLAEVQMISGHRDLRMLMRYTHLAVDDIVKKLRDVA